VTWPTLITCGWVISPMLGAVRAGCLWQWYWTDLRVTGGGALSSQIDTTLGQDACQMALWCRTPSAGLRHHADRGPQYASPAYQGMLAVHGMYCWRSGQSQCRDYAVAERFLSRFKQERTSLHEDAMRQEPQDTSLMPSSCSTTACGCTHRWAMSVRRRLRDAREQVHAVSVCL